MSIYEGLASQGTFEYLILHIINRWLLFAIQGNKYLEMKKALLT